MSAINSVVPTAVVPSASVPDTVPITSRGPATSSGGSSSEASQPNDTQADAKSAAQKRAAHPLFVVTWSLEALRAKLPLCFAADPKLPASPKLRYRSEYRYLGPDLVFDRGERATLSDFQIVVYIVDFSGLERELAQGYPSLRSGQALGLHKGQVPFHPISMFLAICLRLELRLSWKELARRLTGRDGGHWRRLLGFADGQTPCASGLRYFYHHVMGRQTFEQLCERLVTLLRESSLVPTQSTYPGDPPGRGISVTQSLP